MSRITIYCGSSNRIGSNYLKMAQEVGRAIADSGSTLVYGAGRTGMMGAAADAALAAGGVVEGIIPSFMVERGWHHGGITRLVEVAGMHPRKAMMMTGSQGVIALPGGMGTFEELTEAITWRQLGLYGGNVVILNCDNYYDSLISQFQHAAEEGFMGSDHLKLFSVVTTADDAVAAALQPAGKVELTPKF